MLPQPVACYCLSAACCFAPLVLLAKCLINSFIQSGKVIVDHSRCGRPRKSQCGKELKLPADGQRETKVTNNHTAGLFQKGLSPLFTLLDGYTSLDIFIQNLIRFLKAAARLPIHTNSNTCL